VVVFIPLKTECVGTFPPKRCRGRQPIQPQGRVVVLVDKDMRRKSSASEGLHTYGV
jgi:hypothetical protein